MEDEKMANENGKRKWQEIEGLALVEYQNEKETRRKILEV